MNNAQLTLKQENLGKKRKRRKSASLDVRKARAGWLFVLPFVLGFVLIYFPIIYDSLKLTFFKITRGSPSFVGLANYKTALFEDSNFVQTLVSGLTQLVLDIPAIVIFSLFMAVMLNQKMLGRAMFRAIFFVPVILSTGLMADIDVMNSQYLDYMGSEEGINTGDMTASGGASSDLFSAADFTNLFSSMSVGTELVSYVTQLVNNIYNIINRSGVQMLIFLAGLQSISPAIYESCSIDGATSWETFWKITFPMISPMILVNAIYTVIDSFTSSSNQVISYIVGYTESNTVASAMAWVYFVLVIVIVAIVAAILSAYIFYQRRD